MATHHPTLVRGIGLLGATSANMLEMIGVGPFITIPVLPFYPWTAMLAFAGWLYILIASGWQYIAAGIGLLAVGIGAYLVRARGAREWPFEAAA